MKRLLLAVIAAPAMLAGSGEAAEFTPQIDGTMLLEGKIVKGDTKRLYAAVAAEQAKGGNVAMLLLNSPGGSLRESYFLAMVVDGMGLTTGVAAKAVCMSACTTVLAAGVQRHVAMGSLIGVHSAANSQVGDDGTGVEGSSKEGADACATMPNWARVHEALRHTRYHHCQNGHDPRRQDHFVDSGRFRRLGRVWWEITLKR